MVEAQTSFEYDDSGRREQTVYPDNLVPSRSVTYGYDDMDRLRFETHQPATFESREYDSIGNRRYNAEVENGQTTMLSEYTYGGGAGDPLLTEVRTYRDGEGEVEHSILYDAIGNVVNDGIGAYTYDLRNKLLEQSAAAIGSPAEVRYRYDARGYRVLATSLVAGGRSEDWVLDPGGEQLVERTFDQSGQQDGETAFVYLGFRLLARIEGSEAKYVVSNHIGFPQLVASGTGAVLWHARADAFGELVELFTGSDVEDPLRRYPGQWAAAQSATPSSFYNGYRWYNPAQGRYTQADSVGFGVLYLYAANNFFVAFDTQGLETLYEYSLLEPSPNIDTRPRCKPTREMMGCLGTLFSSFVQNLPEIEIVVDPGYVEFHHANAVTRPNSILLKTVMYFLILPVRCWRSITTYTSNGMVRWDDLTICGVGRLTVLSMRRIPTRLRPNKSQQNITSGSPSVQKLNVTIGLIGLIHLNIAAIIEQERNLCVSKGRKLPFWIPICSLVILVLAIGIGFWSVTSDAVVVILGELQLEQRSEDVACYVSVTETRRERLVGGVTIRKNGRFRVTTLVSPGRGSFKLRVICEGVSGEYSRSLKKGFEEAEAIFDLGVIDEDSFIAKADQSFDS